MLAIGRENSKFDSFNIDHLTIIMVFFSLGYAIAEKNTAHATCRKLEEQLEERAKVIRQYVSLFSIVISSLCLGTVSCLLVM